MIFHLQPQPGSENFRCIGESGARRRRLRGARPAHTSTNSFSVSVPRQGTVSICLAHCPSLVSIYLERP